MKPIKINVIYLRCLFFLNFLKKIIQCSWYNSWLILCAHHTKKMKYIKYVCVFPLPVAPYAKIVTFYPDNKSSNNGSADFSYTSF